MTRQNWHFIKKVDSDMEMDLSGELWRKGNHLGSCSSGSGTELTSDCTKAVVEGLVRNQGGMTHPGILKPLTSIHRAR